MLVKQLNGEVLEIDFDSPNQTIFDICQRIWDFQFEKQTENEKQKYYNHFIFENEEGEKITIDKFDSTFDFNKDDLFVDQNRNNFLRKKGHNRQINTSRFSLCHALFVPKKAKILVYCTGKNKFRCIDLHDFSFHVESSLVMVKDMFGYNWVGQGGKVVDNDQITVIDYDSILSHYPNSFKSGSRVFEDSGTKIENYLSKVIRGFQPTYIARDASSRSDYNHKKIIKYC